MAIFSAIAAAVSSFGAWFATLGTIGQFAVQLGLSLGANALASALAGRPKAPKIGIAGEVQQGADVPRSILLGRYATRGSLAYRNTWGNVGDTPNAYYTRITALSDMPVKGLVELWIDGRRCSLDTANPDPDGKGFPVVELTQEKFGVTTYETADGWRNDSTAWTEVRAWVKFYDGTQTTADDFVVNTVSTEDRPWTASDIGFGVAYAVTTFRFDPEVFQGFPDILFVLDGMPLEDPETGQTGTGDDNPAVMAYQILRGIGYRGQWLYGPQGRGAGRVRAAEWAAPVARCKVPVPNAAALSDAEKVAIWGSTAVPARFRAGLELRVDQPPNETLPDILAACSGHLAELGTRYKLHVGEADAAVARITDGDVLSTEAQEFVPFGGIAEAVNGVSAQAPDPAKGWNVESAPPLYDAAAVAAEGGRRLPVAAELIAVPFPEQVQRLQASELAAALRARRHSMVLPPRFLGLEPLDHVDFPSARNGYGDAKLFRVEGVAPRPDGAVQVDLLEVDPDDYAGWIPGRDYVPPAPATEVPAGPPALAVENFKADGASLPDAQGRPRRPALLLTWTAGALAGVAGIEWMVRVKDSRAALPGGRLADPARGAAFHSEGVLPDEVYEVAARYLPGPGQRAVWTDWKTAVSPRDLVQPYEMAPEVWQAVEGRADRVAEQLLGRYDRTRLAPALDRYDADQALRGLRALVLSRRQQQAARTAVMVAREDATAQSAEARQALATARDQLGVAVGNAVALIERERSVRASENAAQASDIATLSAELGATEQDLAAQASAISALDVRVTDTEDGLTSQASQIASLEASLTDTQGDVAAQASAVTSLDTRVTDAEGELSAQATSLTGLTSRVGGNEAWCTTSRRGTERDRRL